jgi:hypothetical protein
VKDHLRLNISVSISEGDYGPYLASVSLYANLTPDSSLNLKSMLHDTEDAIEHVLTRSGVIAAQREIEIAASAK